MNTHTIKNIDELIKAFGGPKKAALLLDTTEQNVCNMRHRGLLPGYHLRVLCLCKERGLKASADLFGIPVHLYEKLESVA